MYKMVFLTVIAEQNNLTVYFDNPVLNPSYIRLVSCSLHNSWHNLKENGQVYFKIKGQKNTEERLLSAGNYDLESLQNFFDKDLEKMFSVTRGTFHRSLIIAPNKDKIDNEFDLSDSLKTLIGKKSGNHVVFAQIVVDRLKTENFYFIHCDLVDKEQNLFNSRPSSILASFDIKGKPYEKVSYVSLAQPMMEKMDVSSLTISIKNEKGELFDFHGDTLYFVLEIN